MNSARFDIAGAILSLHGISLWCVISGVICVIDGDICVIDGDSFQLVVSADDNPTASG